METEMEVEMASTPKLPSIRVIKGSKSPLKSPLKSPVPVPAPLSSSIEPQSKKQRPKSASRAAHLTTSSSLPTLPVLPQQTATQVLTQAPSRSPSPSPSPCRPLSAKVFIPRRPSCWRKEHVLAWLARLNLPKLLHVFCSIDGISGQWLLNADIQSILSEHKAQGMHTVHCQQLLDGVKLLHVQEKRESEKDLDRLQRNVLNATRPSTVDNREPFKTSHAINRSPTRTSSPSPLNQTISRKSLVATSAAHIEKVQNNDAEDPKDDDEEPPPGYTLPSRPLNRSQTSLSIKPTAQFTTLNGDSYDGSIKYDPLAQCCSKGISLLNNLLFQANNIFEFDRAAASSAALQERKSEGKKLEATGKSSNNEEENNNIHKRELNLSNSAAANQSSDPYLRKIGSYVGSNLPKHFSAVKHGTGTLKYANGNVYVGAFVDDLRHGRGSLYFLTLNKIYKGSFCQGALIAEACHVDGSSFLKETYQGRYKRGTSYKGQLVRNGAGILTYPNGNVYCGYFKNDKRHGKGTLKFANGTVYDGLFENDLINDPNGAWAKPGAEKVVGFSKFSFSSRGMQDCLLWTCITPLGTFTGEVINYAYDGRPETVFRFADGTVYDGLFMNHEIYERSEETCMEKAEPLNICDVYCPEYTVNISQYSRGILRYANGDVHKGFHCPAEDGNGSHPLIKEGPGAFYYHDGSAYFGEFSGGIKATECGLMRFASGKVYRGPFINDECSNFAL